MKHKDCANRPNGRHFNPKKAVEARSACLIINSVNAQIELKTIVTTKTLFTVSSFFKK